jgi:hypothetical protein
MPEEPKIRIVSMPKDKPKQKQAPVQTEETAEPALKPSFPQFAKKILPDKRAEVQAKPVKKTAPGKREGGEAKQITIQLPSISIAVTEEFRKKLPMLILLFLIFSFSMILFAQTDFHLSNLFDISRLEIHLSKLYSIKFILFIALYSFSLAIALFFGNKISSFLALLVLPLTLLSTLVIGLNYSMYVPAFVAFALAATATSFLGSLKKEINFSTAWGVVSKALFVLLLVSFIIVFMKVNANKDGYFELFVSGSMSMMPQAQSQAMPALAASIRAIPVDENLVSATITKQRVRDVLANDPLFQNMSDSLKTATVDRFYSLMVGGSVQTFTAVKQSLADQIASSQVNVSLSQTQTKAVVQMLKQISYTKTAYDNLGLAVALGAVSVVAIMDLFIQLLASLFAHLLFKL